MNDFERRHVVVTGGSGALGTAVCAELIGRGAHVHVPVFAPRELDRFPYRNHEQASVRAGLDLTVEATVERYYAELPSLWASIHLAGGFAGSSVVDTSLEGFLELMNRNAVTTFLACREAVKTMRRTGGGGRIVNVASTSALSPSAGTVPYSSSKAVVVALTRGLADEVLGEGILVNAVAPTMIDTPANRAAMPNADRAGWSAPAGIAIEVAHLASPRNSVTRGAILPV
ncbi:MAG: SDR family NAD(P)-dependent oxidoreductase [Sandaracinaceae bacterium]